MKCLPFDRSVIGSGVLKSLVPSPSKNFVLKFTGLFFKTTQLTVKREHNSVILISPMYY